MRHDTIQHDLLKLVLENHGGTSCLVMTAKEIIFYPCSIVVLVPSGRVGCAKSLGNTSIMDWNMNALYACHGTDNIAETDRNSAVVLHQS